MKISLALVLFCGVLLGENWPQFRGPGSNGVSSEKGLPEKWSAASGLAWKARLAGTGTSSPVVWGERVFVTSQAGRVGVEGRGYPKLARDEQALADREAAIGGRGIQATGGGAVELVVEAFSARDGRRVWEFREKAEGPFPEMHEKHNLATPTPVTDGERVFAWFGNGQVFAVDMEGKPVWKKHLAKTYGNFDNNWGHGSSPALVGGLLILLVDHDSLAYLVAFDSKTGREVWKADRGKDRISHSTPMAVAGPSGTELIVNSTARIDAYDAATGKLLWHTGTYRQTPIPSAVTHGGTIYLTRGYRNSDFLALRPGGRGDVTGTHVKWTGGKMGSYVPSLVYYEGLLYMTNEVGVVTCADAETGKNVWRHRLGGIFFASPVAGDGKIYMVSETGETYVLRAGRKAEVISVNDLGERFLASPAVSGGRIFLRSDGGLFAVEKP